MDMENKNTFQQLPCKVLHVTWSGYFAGMLHDILEEQRKDPTISTKIVFCHGIKGSYAQNLIAMGLDVVSLEMCKKYGLISNLKAIFKLKKILRNEQFHIVHMQEILLPFIILTLKWLAPSSKFIIHNRGEFSDNSALSVKAVFLYLKRYIYPLFINRIADKLIVNSKFTAQDTQRVGVNSNLIQTIYNATNTSIITKCLSSKASSKEKILQELKIPEQTYLFGIASRLVKLKRHELVLKAFSFCTIRPKALLVMGEGEELENLQALARQLNISQDVYFLGFRNDCKEIISVLDVAVLPSYQEAFGIAALESVLLEIPTFVMKDGGGLSEFVIDNKNGYVCYDLDELKNKLNLFTSGELTLDHTFNYKNYRQEFSITNYNVQIKQIYIDLLSTSSPTLQI